MSISLLPLVTVILAAVQDCAVSTGVQASISNLNLANGQVLTAVDTINNYNKTEPYLHIIYIARSGMILTQHLTSATTSCCAITTPVSKEESIAVLGVVGSVIPRTEAMYSALVAIKPEMCLNLLVPLAILNAVTNGFAVLDSYLVALAPAEDAATINTYINRISIAFKAAFGIAYAYYYYYCYQAHLFE
ncbi:hypothetical protein HMPREF1544_03774 [Mucor circinelloides 1006PhL]|uniref:Uncharacterized protein n=1 Tax=Mucor circinelloides f. circinelloides (strain 1006PhL) TaxID=1220926 RepID=S2KAT7_MUCC1|nr:hypothetical protein HMPREF1544_03774 [Mucor circinelloides 1006PhL]